MAQSQDIKAVQALNEALEAVMAAVGENPTPTVVRRIRHALEAHTRSVDSLRRRSDPISLPTVVFDPSEPKTIGRMVSLALLAQPKIALKDVVPCYGSGIYAIYYSGDHPFYAGISGTETPIYAGKADPEDHDASSPRQQGTKLSGRILEHAGTIGSAEQYAGPFTDGRHPLRLEDFHCRSLVCATNAQLAAERHLIRFFRPIWNAETKACWGMSKHGDAASTRKNKRSPWDVLHPGRAWASDNRLENSLEPAEIRSRINTILSEVPPKTDHAMLLEEILAGFRQS